MPSFLPGYEYDIFISYRQKDNKGDRWVTQFVNSLRAELETTFKEDISIYFDENPHDGLLETHHVDKSLEGKLKSLIFIPIISQTYCDQKSFAWQQEFCAFNKLSKGDQFGRDIKLANGNVGSRVLPVRIHSLDASDQKVLETEIGSVLRAIEFIYREPGVNRPLNPDDDPSENLNRTKYRNQVNKVANAVKEIIAGLRNFNNPEFVAPLRQQPKVTLGLPEKKSIVVLPFEDISPEKDQEYFCDGLAEELISALTRIKDIRVVARTWAFSFKGKESDVRKIGKKLKVESLLEGSVRKSGNQLRITVQLINVADGYPLWSERYDRTVAEVFSIQDEIALNVVEKLSVRLLGEEKKLVLKRQTENLQAHTYYLKGRHFFGQASVDGMQKATEAFEHAIELDPDYAPAYAALARTLVWVTTAWLALPARDTMPRARKAAQQAIALDPKLSEAHISLALIASFYDWNPVAADSSFQEALRLNPNYSEAHGWYIVPLIWLDTRFDEALKHAQSASDLNPVDPWVAFQLVLAHYFSRDYEGAIKHARHLVNLEPSWGIGHYALGFALATAGRASDAMACLNRAIEMDERGVHCIAWQGLINAITGKNADALSCLAELEAAEKEGRDVSAWKLVVYAGLGDMDAVMRCLDQAFDEQSASLVFHLTHPLVDGLRGDPRFLELLRRMRLEHLASYRPQFPWAPVSLLSKGANSTKVVVRSNEKSIVVLPFEDMSAEKDQEYFCDGMTEEMINSLSQIHDIRVIARTSSFAFKGKTESASEIGRQLNVNYLLEGSVKKSGTKLRIGTSLINAYDQSRVWSATFDRDLVDIFAIQDEITNSVLQQLKGLFSNVHVSSAKRHSANLHAYNYYLLGRYHWGKGSVSGFLKSIENFEAAIGQDQNYALAHVGMAISCWYYRFLGSGPPELTLKLEWHAKEAIKLDNRIGDAHAALALLELHNWNWKTAEIEFQRAIELDPASEMGPLQYGVFLLNMGKYENAMPFLKRAVEIDPLNAPSNQSLAFGFYLMKNYPMAHKQSLRALELDPENISAHVVLTFVLIDSGDFIAAHSHLNAIKTKNIFYDACKAWLLGLEKKSAGVSEVYNQVLSSSSYVPSVFLTFIQIALGDHDKAFEHLNSSLEQRDPLLISIPCFNWWDPIRNDKRFQQVLQRMKLKEYLTDNIPQNEKSSLFRSP